MNKVIDFYHRKNTENVLDEVLTYISNLVLEHQDWDSWMLSMTLV